MQYNEKATFKGVYEFINTDTGEVQRFENVVCQNFFTQVFEAMKGNPSVLDVLDFATGDGTSIAIKTDTALESEQFRKNITQISSTATQLKVVTLLGFTESNFLITEVGLFFSDGGILSRVNVNIDKNASTQFTVNYTLTLI